MEKENPEMYAAFCRRREEEEGRLGGPPDSDTSDSSSEDDDDALADVLMTKVDGPVFDLADAEEIMAATRRVAAVPGPLPPPPSSLPSSPSPTSSPDASPTKSPQKKKSMQSRIVDFFKSPVKKVSKNAHDGAEGGRKLVGDERVIVAPAENQRPIPLFMDPNLEALAFPKEFSEGKNFYNYKRRLNVTLSDYAKNRLTHEDPRWRNLNYLFYSFYR